MDFWKLKTTHFSLNLFQSEKKDVIIVGFINIVYRFVHLNDIKSIELASDSFKLKHFLIVNL